MLKVKEIWRKEIFCECAIDHLCLGPTPSEKQIETSKLFFHYLRYFTTLCSKALGFLLLHQIIAFLKNPSVYNGTFYPELSVFLQNPGQENCSSSWKWVISDLEISRKIFCSKPEKSSEVSGPGGRVENIFDKLDVRTCQKLLGDFFYLMSWKIILKFETLIKNLNYANFSDR
jgi:hypothetical protein